MPFQCILKLTNMCSPWHQYYLPASSLVLPWNVSGKGANKSRWLYSGRVKKNQTRIDRTCRNNIFFCEICSLICVNELTGIEVTTVTADTSQTLHLISTSLVSQQQACSRYRKRSGSCVKASQSESNHWPSTTLIGLITVCQVQLAGMCYTILQQKIHPVKFHLLQEVTPPKAIPHSNSLT